MAVLLLLHCLWVQQSNRCGAVVGVQGGLRRSEIIHMDERQCPFTVQQRSALRTRSMMLMMMIAAYHYWGGGLLLLLLLLL